MSLPDQMLSLADRPDHFEPIEMLYSKIWAEPGVENQRFIGLVPQLWEERCIGINAAFTENGVRQPGW